VVDEQDFFAINAKKKVKREKTKGFFFSAIASSFSSFFVVFLKVFQCQYQIDIKKRHFFLSSLINYNNGTYASFFPTFYM